MYNSLEMNQRKSKDSFIQFFEDGDFFEILINGYLHNSKRKFREFFRINYNQFIFILS